MATVQITVQDTLYGQASICSDFKPAVGFPLTPAQAMALDMLAAARKNYGHEDVVDTRTTPQIPPRVLMQQTKTGSLIESLFNVAIGFAINFVANIFILPLVGFHITPGQNLFIGVLYTLVSVARSYCLRRYFNKKLHAAALQLAQKIT